MKKKLLLACFLAFMGVSGMAQNQEGSIFQNDLPRSANKELQFYAFFINQGVTSNMYPQNSLLKGQVVGRLFGGNTTNTTDSLTSVYFEQRLLPFFVYEPHLFNGKAILRASFEIDWTWGDASYGAGGNFGSAISGDQVNIQTQNIELELIPKKGWYINLGLQRLYDTPYNPYRTMFDKMSFTGYRLNYWGTDGVGISVRHDKDLSHLKAGFYELYESLIQEDDDVFLGELSYESSITRNWKLGASAYYVRDRNNGMSGVSILGSGLNASLLNGYNGTFKFNFGSQAYKADVLWLGTYFSRNADYMLDRMIVNGYINYNLGATKLEETVGNWGKGPSIGGLAANLRLAYRFGQTENDLVSMDVIFTTGDKNGIDDNHYSGVLTGNMWGTPVGLNISSGGYLLFPSLNVVNRFTPVVYDISNMGYGLTGGTFLVKKDIIPYKINAKLGTAFAFSNVAPAGGGMFMGEEFFGSVGYTFGPFMSLEFHAAYMTLGDFFDSNDSSYGYDVNSTYNTGRPVNPWTALIVFKWLMFSN
jgi:hypothetical protein